MEILYDHQMFTVQRFGGITRIFVELARQLSRVPGCAIHWYRGLHRDGYDIRDFQHKLARYWAFSRASIGTRHWIVEDVNRICFKWFVRTSFRQYDVYHPTYYDSSLLGMVKAKRLVVTIYDMIPEKHLADQERFQWLISEKRRLVDAADLILVNSRSTQRDLMEMVPVPSSKIRVTYCASGIREVAPVPLPEVCQNTPYFLYVGTRSKYKNFDILMRTFATSEWLRSNFRVVCFGGTSDYLEPELAFFRDHGLRDRFIYLSGNDSLLKVLYEGAVALVYTSRYEGFGLPPLEAMQCGCPVICCPTSSLPEVVGDAALFFDPDSPEQLAQCMRKVAEDNGTREMLIRKGSYRAKCFSWEKTADATLEGYRAICA